MTLAPILLFTYKRLETLKQTVEALGQNELASESDLFIFSDGAKKENDKETIQEVREYIKTIKGFKSVTISESKTNRGLANSIIAGVNTVLELHDKAIVLEDDLLTTPNFLNFMNCCLHHYSDDKKVFSVSGFSFDFKKDNTSENDAYFLNRSWSWGWATWKDRWEGIDWEVKDYESFRRDRKARHEFAKAGSDVNKMLDAQMQEKLDSWAIRWIYHQFKINGLTVYPLLSKVSNTGFDANATHTKGSQKRYLPNLDDGTTSHFNLPSDIRIDRFYQEQFQNKMGLKARVISKIETLFQKIF